MRIMKKIFTKSAMLFAVMMTLVCHLSMAQTSVSGQVKDPLGETLIGVNVVVKGTVKGTITDFDGKFSLSVDQAPPFSLIISIVGYESQEIEITESQVSGIEVTLDESLSFLSNEVVVSASRVEESILESPVTIEKMDILAIKQSAGVDFFESISNLKGVSTAQGSLTFNAINTRGFATIANVRFVTLVDGMDISAPLLNFPTGNLVGISELDVESVELVPGAASALYGPNAFNGILFMNSKSPFEYQGLSAQVKYGGTSSNAGGSDPLTSASFRYAKAINDKLAFKVNGSFLRGTDWIGNDYVSSRVDPNQRVGDENFDGMNLYGDETPIIVNIAEATGDPSLAPLGTIDVRRTGWEEETLLDSRDAESIKADFALHYRPSEKVELLYNYRYGGGSSIYQGSGKFVLRDFTQQFHKIEAKGDNFFVRAYRTATDDGDSYNMDALGAFLNERVSPSSAEWVPNYLQNYILAIQGYVPGVQGGNQSAAHTAARAAADASRNALTDAQVQDLIQQSRTENLQNDPFGAGFVEGSQMYHGEFNYNFKNQIDWAEIQIGGNVRRYSIFSQGTIFDETRNPDGSFDRVEIDEWGAYTQIAKRFNDLKVTGSLRYDKNENFEGQLNPRLSAVYTINGNHNIRASFQTGFRNPDSQAQFIWFPTSSGILVGSTEANAERYGIHGPGNSIDPATGEPLDIDFVQPEELTSFEIGYKGIIDNRLMLDVNYYHNEYDGFIANRTVFNANPVIRRGDTVRSTTGSTTLAFNPYINVPADISSDGIGVGINYSLGKGYSLTGSYDWATFNISNVQLDGFIAGFNTPEHKYSVSLSNRNIGENIGFNITYRWQDDFVWESTFGSGPIPAYGVFDFQLNYKWEELKSVIKVGGTNLLGSDYRTNIGAGFVGTQYYVSVTFDEFLN